MKPIKLKELIATAKDPATQQIAIAENYTLYVVPLFEGLVKDIDSIKVENAYKRRGIATGMLDFAVSLALPETIGLFCANEDAEMKAMLKALKFAQSPLKAQNMPWKEKYFYYKRLKRLAR